MVKTSACRAKNPATCRVHGIQTDPIAQFMQVWQPARPKHNLEMFQAAGRIRHGLKPFLRQQTIDWALRDRLRREHGERYNALSGYMRYDYEFVNAHLRGSAAWAAFISTRRNRNQSGGYPDVDETEYRSRAATEVTRIDQFLQDMQRNFTAPEGILYRFETPFAGQDVPAAVATYRPGMVFEAPAYTSTSMDPNAVINIANDPSYPDEFYVFEILSRRGIEVHRLAGGMGDEHEVLLPRNSRFQVHRVMQASYETGLNWAQQQRRGFFGYEGNRKKAILKKRFNIVQVIDVTDG